jgi:hypothetical protein
MATGFDSTRIEQQRIASSLTPGRGSSLHNANAQFTQPREPGESRVLYILIAAISFHSARRYPY